MEQNKEYYSNFKCYDSKGRRLAIFGRQKANSIQIVEIKCSKDDQFHKSIAKRVYEEWLKKPLTENHKGQVNINGFYGTFHPEVYTIFIIEENKSLWTFNQHCKNNYYHKVIQLRRREYEETVLIKNNAKTIPLNSKRLYKMY